MPTGIYERTEEVRKNLSEAHKGKTLSEENKRNISKSLKGIKRQPFNDVHKRKISESKKGQIPWNKGIPMAERTKKKISEANKDKICSEETREKISKICKGNTNALGSHRSEEFRRKISESLKGKNSYLWKGGITPENGKIRNGIKYRLWREAVFARDNWTCQECNKRGSQELNAHHIKNFSEYPELRFAINNGITLCRNCHRTIREK